MKQGPISPPKLITIHIHTTKYRSERKLTHPSSETQYNNQTHSGLRRITKLDLRDPPSVDPVDSNAPRAILTYTSLSNRAGARSAGPRKAGAGKEVVCDRPEIWGSKTLKILSCKGRKYDASQGLIIQVLISPTFRDDNKETLACTPHQTQHKAQVTCFRPSLLTILQPHKVFSVYQKPTAPLLSPELLSMAQYAGLGLKAANLLIDRHFENIPDRHFKKIPDPAIFPQQTFCKFRRRRKQNATQQAPQNSQPDAEDRSEAEQDRRDYSDDSGADSSYSNSAYSAPNRGVRRHPGERAYPYPQEAQPPSGGYYNPPHAPSQHDPSYAAPRHNPYLATHDSYPPPSLST
jgi:hypothetical protein